jgi:hypothetical protein
MKCNRKKNLQMSQRRLNRIRSADAAEAGQRKVVVQHQSLFGVVEALHVLKQQQYFVKYM